MKVERVEWYRGSPENAEAKSLRRARSRIDLVTVQFIERMRDQGCAEVSGSSCMDGRMAGATVGARTGRG